MRVSEIRLKRIRVNQGLGVLVPVADNCLKFETSKHSTHLYFQQGKGPSSRQA